MGFGKLVPEVRVGSDSLFVVQNQVVDHSRLQASLLASMTGCFNNPSISYTLDPKLNHALH